MAKSVTTVVLLLAAALCCEATALLGVVSSRAAQQLTAPLSAGALSADDVRRSFSSLPVGVNTNAGAGNFTVLICDDIAKCNPARCLNMTMFANRCIDVGILGSREWHCDTIRTLQCLHIAHYSTDSCAKGTEMGNKWYYCGGCKDNVKRDCTWTNGRVTSVTFSNCSDDRCQVGCKPMYTSPLGACSPAGQRLVSSRPCRGMLHKWYPGPGCNASAPGAGQDFIVLDECIWAVEHAWRWDCGAAAGGKV